MRKNRLPILFFLLYFTIGIGVVGDYGISFDEPTNRVNGLVSAKYVIKTLKIPIAEGNLKKIPELHNYVDKDYGVVFDLPLVIVEKLTEMLNIDVNIYLIRHFFTFLLFFTAVIFFYMTAFFISENQFLSLLITLFLVLSPRIFAESFYNSKDLGCLSFFIISTYFLFRFVKNFDFKYGIWLSVMTAMTINSRIIGLIIPSTVILMAALSAYQLPMRKKVISAVGVYLLLTIGFTILLWPFLWEAPLQNFWTVWGNMKKFRWGGEVLYLRHYIKATELPWHYIPVYLFITTPLLYSLFFFIGLICCIGKLIYTFQQLYRYECQVILICLILFFGPIVATIVFDSVVYDGWRQLYFTYGAFLLIALFGLEYIYIRIVVSLFTNRIKIGTLALITLYVVYIGYWMVKYHPHQNVYFNTLAGKDIENSFERDYWGLSYKQALEYITRTDNRANITIICNLPPGVFSSNNLLPEKERQRMSIRYLKPLNRIKATEAELQCDYFITEFRYIPDPKPFYKQMYSIYVDDFKIIAVYDGKHKKY